MPAPSDTGHTKNAAHFQNLMSFCIGYGPMYNPSNEAIKIEALADHYSNAVAALSSVNAHLAAHTHAVNERGLAFAALKTFITRVTSAADACDLGTNLKADVKTIARKLQGRRAAPKKEATEGEAAPKQISASQMSFDQRMENFDKLVQLLATQPHYTPNEPELSVLGLTNTVADLRAKHQAVRDASTALSNARIARNKILYAEGTGTVALSLNVKSYVKSLFGHNSPQYKQVRRLVFMEIRV